MSFPEVVDIIPSFPELSPAAIPDILNTYVVPAIQALEVKVGADSSTDTNSLDYKVAHGGGGGGGGSTNVPAGAVAFGDGLSPAGVTGDASGIMYDDVEDALVFPNLWSLDFADSAGGFGGFIADVDTLILVTTNASHDPVFALKLLMNTDTPTITSELPFILDGSNGEVIFNDQEGRQGYFKIFNNSGGISIFSEDSSQNIFGLNASGIMGLHGNGSAFIMDDQSGGNAITVSMASGVVNFALSTGGTPLSLSSSFAQVNGTVQAFGLTIAEGFGNQGLAVMSAGSATVADSAVTNANSRIFVTSQSAGVIGALRVVITDGIGFVITSSVGGDAGNVAYIINGAV
jgi:hypothetical protein